MLLPFYFLLIFYPFIFPFYFSFLFSPFIYIDRLFFHFLFPFNYEAIENQKSKYIVLTSLHHDHLGASLPFCYFHNHKNASANFWWFHFWSPLSYLIYLFKICGITAWYSWMWPKCNHNSRAIFYIIGNFISSQILFINLRQKNISLIMLLF